MKQLPRILALTILFLPACNSSTSEMQRMEEALKLGEIMYQNNENNAVAFIPELDKASAYFASKKQYQKAAQAALYYGYCEQEHDKESAMESLEKAWHYGSVTADSLTAARAQYHMGRLLYFEGTEREALERFRNAEAYAGSAFEEKASAENMMACCQMLLSQLDSAAYSLRRSLENAELAGSNETRNKVLNNYAILCRLKGDYDKAIYYLRQIKTENEEQILLYHLNLGNAFALMKNTDSAAFYYNQVEEELSSPMVKDETRVSAYGSFSQFAESRREYYKALEYRKKHEYYNGELRDKYEQKRMYYIQKKYDYENLQRKMSEKLLYRRHIILILSLLLVVILSFTLVLYHRYIQKRLHEVELNNILLQFIEQNKELLREGAKQEQERLKLIEQLSDIQKERIKAIQKLEVFLKDRRNLSALNDLEHQIFSGQDHWKVMLELIDMVYPGLYDCINKEYPSIKELEKRVLLLSHFRLSRNDEATLLGVSTSVLDKVRGRIRRLKNLDYFKNSLDG